MTKTIAALARQVIHARTGRLTEELTRVPGGFGLGQVPKKQAPTATTTAVCGFCSTGCGLDVHLQNGKVVNLSPSVTYPVNLGMACPKGWEALTPLYAKDRATTPLLRKNGKLVRVGWPEALAHFAERVKSIQGTYGHEAMAFLSTGQIPTEEMAFLGALTKFGMGIKHGDGNTRQCMATAVVAYKQAFGFDAPPYTYADFEQSDVIVFVGANPCIAHPIMWERVCRNPNKPEIVVIDPRKTETAAAATQHLAIAPKSDLRLFYGLANYMIQREWVDYDFLDAHTEGFDAFAEFVSSFSLEDAATASGVALEALEKLALSIHRGKRVSFWWTMGVNQSHEGVLVAQAIINLALLTGNIGRPGTGANSITGQCNAMGSRLFSNTTNLLGGHDFGNEAHRSKVAKALQIPESVIPHETGLAYDQIMEGILKGQIKGLWIIATNTAHSWINQNDARSLLDKLEFLVVQDMYHSTETAAHADLLLPAAGWGEKEGTFINSERRIGLLKKVSKAPGEALSDFHIFRLIAHAYGCESLFEEWKSPEDVFRLLAECTKGQPCDFSGIDSYHALDALRGVQWPAPSLDGLAAGSERRLFEDARFYHASGRARLCFGEPTSIPESTSKRFPLLLLTGRGSSSQWHTQTRTAKSDVLRKLSPQNPYVEINPRDAVSLGIEQNAWVEIRSSRGRMDARAYVTHIVRPGQVFIPMHYEETNRLTFPAFDPQSRQPAYKACAVSVEPK